MANRLLISMNDAALHGLLFRNEAEEREYQLRSEEIKRQIDDSLTALALYFVGRNVENYDVYFGESYDGNNSTSLYGADIPIEFQAGVSFT